MPESRVTVIPNAVDIANFQFDVPPDVAARQSLGLEGKTVIGFIGSFYGYEGLDLLLDALPKVSAGRDDVTVLLVGGGPNEGDASRDGRRDSRLDRQGRVHRPRAARRRAPLLQHRRHLARIRAIRCG